MDSQRRIAQERVPTSAQERVMPHESLRICEACRLPDVSDKTTRSRRSSSPSDQAWNGQPRGVWGGSASAISDTCPSPAWSRWLCN